MQLSNDEPSTVQEATQIYIDQDEEAYNERVVRTAKLNDDDSATTSESDGTSSEDSQADTDDIWPVEYSPTPFKATVHKFLHKIKEHDLVSTLQPHQLRQKRKPTRKETLAWFDPEYTINNLNTHIGRRSNHSTPKTCKAAQDDSDAHGTWRVQNDPGANRNVTNNRSMLIKYQTLSRPLPMNGVSKDGPVIECEGYGYFPWENDEGNTLLIKCYYCSDVSETLLAPTAIVKQYRNKFKGWTLDMNYDKQNGNIRFLARDGVNHVNYRMHMVNDLCYHRVHRPIRSRSRPRLSRLSAGAEAMLWHQRLGHPGTHVMRTISEKVKGIPKLIFNDFHKCNACQRAKFHKQAQAQRHIHSDAMPPPNPKVMTAEHKHSDPPQTSHFIEIPIAHDDPQFSDQQSRIGQHLHMDFGFVRGKDWHTKDKDGRKVTSIDGFNSYLLIIDRASRYLWIFLAKSKHPPLKPVSRILEAYGKAHGHKTVWTDLGGELARSSAFRDLIMENGYSLETTGAHSSFQNALAERPHRDLANIMRSLLYNANMGPEYWSFALTHAVYLKNRWPHRTLSKEMTPYQALTGKIPDLSHLRVFGARVYGLAKPKRWAKLDDITFSGRFLTFTATSKIINILDEKTNRIRTASEFVFDEAHATLPPTERPVMAEILYQCGYTAKPFDSSPPADLKPTDQLKVKLLSTQGHVPTRSTPSSIGYDLSSAVQITIGPGECKMVGTDIAIECH
jgi:hypothetical protein